MKTFDPHKPIIYTHIPKCAGTSIIHALNFWFSGCYFKLNQDESQDQLLPRVETQDDHGNWLPNVKCIQGHFNHGRGYGLPYFYPEIDQYFTIMRDPFDIVVSMYFFAKGRSQQGKLWSRGQPVDFMAQYACVDEYLRAYPDWLYHHLPQDITLDNCVEKLNERFVYIGVYEDLKTSITQLTKIFKRKYWELPVSNSSRYDERVPIGYREKFYRDHPLLKKIHDFALEHYRDPVE